MNHLPALALPALALLIVPFAGCTGQVPGSFRLAQQEQSFGANLQINTKLDLLWVVDNSASMDTAQDKLRRGFAAFAQKYMQPTWDIRVGVITTDTYLANPAYSGYLNSVISGTVGWSSPYVNGRLGSFVNPPGNPTLVNLGTGHFDSGVRIKDLVPAWGSNYARLLPGMHDGPVAGFCFEGLPYLLNGATQCQIRDNQAAYNGVSHCLNPTGAETAETQCVNTIENNTVHSGTAIISTMPATTLAGAALTAWQQQLYDSFAINITTGSNGNGSERGLQSVQQLLQDNEGAASPTRFFRAGSLRAIIFVSDEDDQSVITDSPVPAGYQPMSHYQCDQASLVAQNGAPAITGNNGYCCTTPANHCTFGAEGTSCPAKTVDGYTYTIGICPVASKLLPVAQFKSQLDNFFTTLDGADASAPSTYFVTSIVALTGSSLQALHTLRQADDTNAGQLHMYSSDRGDRYIQLGNLVGNGSMALDLGAGDYSPFLDSIGKAIIQKKSTFTLARAPTNSEEMIIRVQHADGTSTNVSAAQYVIQDKSIVITDSSLVLSFAASDQIIINYQPLTVY